MVDSVVGGEEAVVGPPPADASWNNAILSGNTSTLSLYFARELPFCVTMLVVPTVFRQ
jgi:hypothetical protein